MQLPAPAVAQHEGHQSGGVVYPPFGSGTSWLPAVAPMRGVHFQAADWRVMVHGSVFGQFVQESGPRGNYQLGSVNWIIKVATSFIWAANIPTDTRRVLNTVLLETNVDLDARNAIFGRVEYVRRTAEELALVGSISPEVQVGSLAAGYARRVRTVHGIGAWLGARGHVNVVPEQLRLFYGSRTPAGFLVYLQIKP